MIIFPIFWVKTCKNPVADVLGALKRTDLQYISIFQAQDCVEHYSIGGFSINCTVMCLVSEMIWAISDLTWHVCCSPTAHTFSKRNIISKVLSQTEKNFLLLCVVSFLQPHSTPPAPVLFLLRQREEIDGVISGVSDCYALFSFFH